MRGYHDDPDETAAVLDAEGWLRTGDIGVMDARGYLRITDRKKDMFIVGGFNAYPAEIERVLLGHPAVAQAAVVGVPEERLGEVGVAFVVLRAGAALADDELVAWSRERMANYKVPRRVEVVRELPLNATGKVLKYVLREQARDSFRTATVRERSVGLEPRPSGQPEPPLPDGRGAGTTPVAIRAPRKEP
jgi:acyl-CoA synthetase (AMP-forming)/AMP-acid ligase II